MARRYLLDRFQSVSDEVVTLFAQTIHDRRAVNGGRSRPDTKSGRFADMMSGVCRCKKKLGWHGSARCACRSSEELIDQNGVGTRFSRGLFCRQTGCPRPYDRYIAGNFVHELARVRTFIVADPPNVV
jgi:hypothetical protein